MTEQEWERTLDELLDADTGLSTWEIGFIEDMDKLRGRELTERQQSCLDRIAERIT